MKKYEAVIFDLDGVIVSTDEYHYQAWQQMADEEKIYFDREINHRLRGVSRMASLEIVLEKASRSYNENEKIELSERKNTYYVNLLNQLSPDDILSGVLTLLQQLKADNIKIAIGSSSRNTPLILKQIGLDKYFDAIADGNQITNSKPDPEVFLLAARKMSIAPELCIVVEDAPAGIEAALSAGCKAVAVGDIANSNGSAAYSVATLDLIDYEQFLS